MRVWNFGFRYKFCIKLRPCAKGNGVVCQKLKRIILQMVGTFASLFRLHFVSVVHLPIREVFSVCDGRSIERERQLLRFSCIALACVKAEATFNLINK